MIELIAIRQIRHACGTIEPEQPFLADEHDAERYIKQGQALPARERHARPWSGRGYWHVQPEWVGQTVAIVAGGPSLTGEQVAQLSHDQCRIIAINNALGLVPEADILYFCDNRWYEWHREQVQAFKGVRVTLENLKLQNEVEVRCLHDYGVFGFTPESDGVTNGRNSGYQALQLAVLLGSKRVLLLGYDMCADATGRKHWHDEHPAALPPNIFAAWLQCFDGLALELARRNIEVLNCTPGSALTLFPQVPLADALRGDDGKRSVAMRFPPEKLIGFRGFPDEPHIPEPAPLYKPLADTDDDAPPPADAPAERAGHFGGAGASASWDGDDDSKPGGE